MDASSATYSIAVSKYVLKSKIPLNDPFWKEFNAGFSNELPTCLGLVDSIYGGHAFTTWHANHWRAGANYVKGQHLALDFDTENDQSSLTSLAQDMFIRKYGAFLYATPSSTPTAPRTRVVFLLDTPIMQAKNYAEAATALLWLYHTADRQCKDPARFFYGSVDCDAVYLENVLPLDVVKHLIVQYRESGQKAKRVVQRPDWRPPTDQQTVAEALRTIPAWGIDYDQWLACLMAIHSEFGDAGLPLACAWAEGTPNEVEKKWRGFSPTGNSLGNAVTVGTIFHLAKQFGWRKI